MQSPPKAAAGYAPLLREVLQFFKTGKPPVANDETLEIFAFMDAAQRSKEAGGKPTKLRSASYTHLRRPTICSVVRSWLNRAVSKTVEPLRVPWVRIPPSPPELNQ